VNGGQPLFNFTPINASLRNDQRFSHYEVAPWADLYADFAQFQNA
jgi:hypothetical protein